MLEIICGKDKIRPLEFTLVFDHVFEIVLFIVITQNITCIGDSENNTIEIC